MALGLQEITGCIGLPVAGNPTQYVMEKAYAQAGLEWRYLTMEVSADALSDAVRGMKALGFHGYNCTEPHRSAVIPLLDGTTDAARQIGAVNCVFRDGEKMEFSLGPENYSLVKIPPETWYAFQGQDDAEAVVAVYMDHPHDPAESEKKDPSDPSFGIHWTSE